MSDELAPKSDNQEMLHAVRQRTDARILVGAHGTAYPTQVWLKLREDHAAARDAVQDEIDLHRDLGTDFINHWRIFEIQTEASTKSEYLLRPDLGRRLTMPARVHLQATRPDPVDVHIAIGDGLSAAAVRVQVPLLLPGLVAELQRVGLRVGNPFFIRHCRVGVLNDLGILDADVFVLLIGERPGLATSESLSAYLAHRPAPGHTDARRNLISNIHDRGVPVPAAAHRIARLCHILRTAGTSGVDVKE